MAKIALWNGVVILNPSGKIGLYQTCCCCYDPPTLWRIYDYYNDIVTHNGLIVDNVLVGIPCCIDNTVQCPEPTNSSSSSYVGDGFFPSPSPSSEPNSPSPTPTPIGNFELQVYCSQSEQWAAIDGWSYSYKCFTDNTYQDPCCPGELYIDCVEPSPSPLPSSYSSSSSSIY